MPVCQTFFKFSHHLIEHFHKIDISHLQSQISGACFGSFHHIFCKTFQSVSFCVQDFQIFQDFRICKIFSFQKIYVIDDGSQWCFQIMRNIGNKFCF